MPKKNATLCSTPYCRNKRESKRNKKCSKCRKKAYRLKNVVKAAYQNKRANAKERGKIFQLSFEEFESFYLSAKIKYGVKFSRDLTIDCIKPHLGYVAGNLQALTLVRNSCKGARVWLPITDYHTGEITYAPPG